MASLIPGYEYDIFISYRHKDNKYDGWVTDFVNNLKGELEATFKEDISVYFDVNPHDGLLETHDVEESLRQKLKCLIFIPIISRTYCDPKSFAWEHEFKAFVDHASKDQFGLKVKLLNGNVASRVLPVRIHDLDASDVKECESVLGGALRGIEFIYKETGIDKPLAPGDNEKKNLNNTTFRIQIIKVAHGIKEIISGLRAGEESGKEIILHKKPAEEIKYKDRAPEKPVVLPKRKLITVGVVSGVLLVITIILAFPEIFKRDKLERLRSSGERISVAVMPFQNMTNDTIWNVWQDVIQTNITTFLSNYPGDLKVSQTELVNRILQKKGYAGYNTLTSSLASSISGKLNADVFINGSINQSGSTIRLNAQLVDSKTKDAIKSFQIDGTVENIISLIDSLSIRVKDVLIISTLGKEFPPEIARLWSVTSPEAFRYFKSGQDAFNDRDWNAAANFYLQAIGIDSNFTFAAINLSYAYLNLGMYNNAKTWCRKVYERKDQMVIQQKLMTNWLYANCFETPYEQIKYLSQLLDIDEQVPNYHFLFGIAYRELNQYDKAISEYERALKIYSDLGIKPQFTGNYSHLLVMYYNTRQYDKERELFKKAEIDFPDNSDLMYEQSVLLLTEAGVGEANSFIEKYKSIRREQSRFEASINNDLASIYRDANIPEKAEEYYRKAISNQPENPVWLNNLAFFLIDKDLNVNEGLEVADKALRLIPDNYTFMDTKGWGLYKAGKFQEALEILQKSWSLRLEKAVYNYEAYLHLEAAKKAVAGQKNY